MVIGTVKWASEADHSTFEWGGEEISVKHDYWLFFCMLPSASYNFNSFFGGWRNFFLVMLLLFLAPKQLAAYAPT